MRLRFVAIATCLLVVGAHAEPPEVSPLRGSTEAPSYNEEERHPLNEIAQALGTHLAPSLKRVIDQPRVGETQNAILQPRSKRLRTSQNKQLSAHFHHQLTDQDLLNYHANHITNRGYIPDDIPQNVHAGEAENGPLSADFHYPLTDQDLLNYHANHITNRGYTPDDIPQNVHAGEAENGPLSADFHYQLTDQDLLNYHGNHITNRGYIPDEITQNVHAGEAVAKMKNAETDLNDEDLNSNVFKRSGFNHWIKQVTDFINDHPNANLNLVDFMSLDAKTLLDMADAAYKTKPHKSADVQKVLEALHHSWSRWKPTPEVLYLVLGLNRDEGTNFESLRFKEWMKYSIDYEKPDEEVTTHFHSGEVHG